MNSTDHNINSDLKDCALRLLARREHSQLELKQKLLQRGFAAHVIDEVIANLAEIGLQSDERFAENYVHFRAERGFGPRRLKEELRTRGVDAEIIARVIDVKADYWNEIAKKVFTKKFKLKPKDFSDRAKALAFLEYRGFSSANTKQILDE
jgi:regulatory protein